jgi:hypothetical protein
VTRTRPAFALLALLAACSPEPAPQANDAAAPVNLSAPPTGPATNTAAAPAAQPAPALAIEGEGLRLFDPATGAARSLPFGTPQATVMAAVAALGRAETNRLQECGAGPLDAASWPSGPTLYFQDGKFVGWAVGGPSRDALATAAGIRIGSTRAELESVYAAKVFESSLGTEFEAGTLFGTLDGEGAKAKITNLWAGTSCNMR